MAYAARSLVLATLLIAPLFVFTSPAEAYTAKTGVVESFDGTEIVYTLFLPPQAATSPVPVVLRTHGWGGAREVVPSGTSKALILGGYAVITWDARGFGDSGGTTQLDSPDFEVKDTQAILDLVEDLPQIKKDANGVVAAMSGVSYAGAVQLLTSAFDGRLRAIAPEIAWNDLGYALAPNGVVKNQWIQGLFATGLTSTTTAGFDSPAGPQAQGYDTNLPTWYAQTMATNGGTPEVLDALAYRSPKSYESALTTPTLFIQGWPDSLFTVNEAVANFEATVANGAPAKMILYCGGHAGCPYTDAGQRAYLDAAIVKWFNKHVKGQVVDTGPAVEYFDNTGALRSASAWPVATSSVTTSRIGDVWLHPVPTAGGVMAQSSSMRPNQDPRFSGFRVPLDIAPGTEVTGIPTATIQILGGTHQLSGDVTLFVRLVDTTVNHVVDGVTTPVRFTCSELFVCEETETFDLTAVSYVLPAGHALALEVSANDAAFSSSRYPGLVQVRATVTVPIV